MANAEKRGTLSYTPLRVVPALNQLAINERVTFTAAHKDEIVEDETIFEVAALDESYVEYKAEKKAKIMVIPGLPLNETQPSSTYFSCPNALAITC